MPDNETNVKSSEIQKTKRNFRYVIYCIVIATIIMMSAGGFLYFNVYLPQGSGPAGPDVPDEPFKRIWNERKVMLFGIGDDITDGANVREGFSYFQRLFRNLNGDSPGMAGKNLSLVFPNLTTTNTASSWSNSINHYEALEMMSPYPDDIFGIAVMTTGCNDILHNYGKEPPTEGAMYGATIEQALPWIDNFQNRLTDSVMHIRRLFPGGCQIFIANIYDITDGMGNTSSRLTGAPAWSDGLSILDGYNLAIKECAEKYDNVYVVDIHKTFLGHGLHCRKFWIDNYKSGDPTFWYQTKASDPSANERGHDAIRRLFLNKMITVFADETKLNKN